jgi:hypothetical protein
MNLVGQIDVSCDAQVEGYAVVLEVIEVVAMNQEGDRVYVGGRYV